MAELLATLLQGYSSGRDSFKILRAIVMPLFTNICAWTSYVFCNSLSFLKCGYISGNLAVVIIFAIICQLSNCGCGVAIHSAKVDDSEEISPTSYLVFLCDLRHVWTSSRVPE